MRPESQFPFAADLYASYSWEGVRNSAGGDGSKIMLGRRPLKAYLQRPAEELYDMDNDPDEVNNLAADPQHGRTLVEMRTRLEEMAGEDWRSVLVARWSIIDCYQRICQCWRKYRHSGPILYAGGEARQYKCACCEMDE